MEYQSIVYLILNVKGLGAGLRKILILIKVQRLSRKRVHLSKVTPQVAGTSLKTLVNIYTLSDEHFED